MSKNSFKKKRAIMEFLLTSIAFNSNSW